jgi:hypothetical protein
VRLMWGQKLLSAVRAEAEARIVEIIDVIWCN